MDQKTIASPMELDKPELYINRELSWIEFNRRVFEEAHNKRHPLLERVKFISIFDTNLDEFYMIRVAGLKDQVASEVEVTTPDGMTAGQVLAAVRKNLVPLIQEVRLLWCKELVPELAEKHIHVLDYKDLDQEQRTAMRTYFEQEIFPVLTPLAVDAGHPFPHISNRSLNLAVVIVDEQSREFFARVKIPPVLPRLIPVPFKKERKAKQEGVAYAWLEQVIAENLITLFPGYVVRESYPFRVLRDADVELREDDSLDLLETITQGLRERRFGSVVDLAVNPTMPRRIQSLLLDKLEITASDLTIIDGPLGLGDVMELHSLDRPDLKDQPYKPRIPPQLLDGKDLFKAIKKHDLLMHYPYDTFDSVVEFIRAAARDPQVLAIKQTLYRVGTKSPVVQALLEAVEKGKQVAVLVELKARFDEEHNIEWARALEKAGVHVVYGLPGLKIHAKIALVVRKEGKRIHRYVHLGTGNYNATTARIYEDLCLLTCRPDIGADASELFNLLTGYSHQKTYRKLLVAPLGLRRALLERIEREIHAHKEHENGYLSFKMNALVDPEIIQALYLASQAGVQIDLMIRGICCLRPGIPGVSDTIRVRSFLGRFLEHSRIYYFRNGGNEEMYLGSADMMQRNLDHRVETLFPVEDSNLRKAIRTRLLDCIWADTANARELLPDGTYVHLQPAPDESPFDSQNWFITHPLLDPEPENDVHTFGSFSSGV